MRVRALDANGDYAFGRGQANFLVNSPSCVGQLVQTALQLWQGEWFLDTTQGTPWLQKVLGKSATTPPSYDMALQTVILGVQGVTSIQNYTSSLAGRLLTVTMTLNTLYGQTKPLTVVLGR